MFCGAYFCKLCNLRPIKSIALQKVFPRSLSCSALLYKASTSKSSFSNVVTTADDNEPITDCEGKKLSSQLSQNKPLEAKITSLPQQYLMLSKIRLTSLVVMTSMCGYAMAPAPFDLATVAMCTLGTGLLSCAANAINQFHEVPFDAQMARTRNRLLVKSVVTPLHAFGFAAVCASTGGLLLYFGVNPLTASLGVINLVLYTSIYTPLKRISILNTWVGSIVGALPPLMGWAGAMGSLGSGAWILGGILYAWQFPHFNALSWNLRPDYSRAGYRMMAVTNPGLCRRTTLRYTAAIMALSCAAPLVDLTNYWFVLESMPLNSYFMYLGAITLIVLVISEGTIAIGNLIGSIFAWKFYKESDSASSRKLFRFSLIHLPVLMLLMLINKKPSWFREDTSESNDKAEETPS